MNWIASHRLNSLARSAPLPGGCCRAGFQAGSAAKIEIGSASRVPIHKPALQPTGTLALLRKPIAQNLCALLSAAILLAAPSARAQTNDSRSLVLVIGAPGAPEYSEQFSNAAALWKRGAAQGGLQPFVIGEDPDHPQEDRRRLLEVLTNEVGRPAGELWLVLLGHGTFDGRAAKFNLRGPDLSAAELAAVLKPCRRPLAVIDCGSASGPFLAALAESNRVVIAATRSGYELNATRFGVELARAIADPAADLDQDGQTSLLEAYLSAARAVESFYKDAGRLATEHALLDDNGDGLGTPADWFQGVRAVKSAAAGKSVDGVRAHQMVLVRGDVERELSPAARARRDELEQQLGNLRARKSKMDENEYFGQLETLLLGIARLYEQPQKP